MGAVTCYSCTLVFGCLMLEFRPLTSPFKDASQVFSTKLWLRRTRRRFGEDLSWLSGSELHLHGLWVSLDVTLTCAEVAFLDFLSLKECMQVQQKQLPLCRLLLMFFLQRLAHSVMFCETCVKNSSEQMKKKPKNVYTKIEVILWCVFRSRVFSGSVSLRGFYSSAHLNVVLPPPLVSYADV